MVGLAGLALAGIAGAGSYAFRSGQATRARASIEEAIAAIHRQLYAGAEIDWAQQDAVLEPRCGVLPLRQPTAIERALGWFGRWLGTQFRV